MKMLISLILFGSQLFAMAERPILIQGLGKQKLTNL